MVGGVFKVSLTSGLKLNGCQWTTGWVLHGNFPKFRGKMQKINGVGGKQNVLFFVLSLAFCQLGILCRSVDVQKELKGNKCHDR